MRNEKGSLPSRERELKRHQQPQRAERFVSLPSRERELKRYRLIRKITG